MILFILSITTKCINISHFVDGLENVEYQHDIENQKTHFYITEDNIFLFYQNTPNLKIKIQNKRHYIRTFSNPYQIPKYSIIKISANWSQYNQNDNYLIGFVNGKNCDYIYYSNSPNFTFPSKFFINAKRCFYHFTKNSTIKIGKKQFSNKLVSVNKENQDIEMLSHFNNKNSELKGMVRVTHEHKNILENEEDDISDLEMTSGGGSFMLAFAILLNIVGIILYLIFGLAFGIDSCDCSCGCCCCCKQFWEDHNIKNLDYDNRDNKFFTETLQEFDCKNGKIHNND